jgi:anti-sigma factor RsiW
VKLCLQLDQFLDGELSDSQAQAFETHLSNCEACRSEVQADRQLDQALQSAWANINAPATIADALQPRRLTVKGATGDRILRHWRRFLLAASFVAALAGGSWLVWFAGTGETEVTQTLVKPAPPAIESTGTLPADQPTSHQLVTVLYEPESQTILLTESTSDDFTILTAYEMN